MQFDQKNPRIQFIKETSREIGKNLKGSFVIATRPDHPFLFSGPDILIGGDGNLTAIFVPKSSEAKGSKELAARVIAAKLALPAHTKYAYLLWTDDHAQEIQSMSLFDEIFRNSQVRDLAIFFEKHEVASRKQREFTDVRVEAMVRYGVMLDLSRVNKRKSEKERRANPDRRIDLEREFASLEPTGRSRYIKKQGEVMVGVRKLGANISFMEGVYAYSVESITRQWAVDSGIPFVKQRSPSLIAVDNAPISRFDPEKPVRAAAFSGWAVKLLTGDEDLPLYVQRFEEAYYNLLHKRMKEARP